jgi:glycosyltransferase involved in cell wall biosynthesis
VAPLISILIPCFNAEKFVGEAIESALAQTHPNVEVVVVDDGSTDNSVEVIRSFGDRVIAEFGPNRGACAARNRALALSRGQYVQFLDADDLLFPHKIERQLPILERNEADFVFSRGTLFGDGKPERTKKKPIAPLGDTDRFVYALHQGISTEDPLHRRELVERIGGFREHIRRAQEYDLHVRLAAAGVRFTFLDEVLSRHRHHDGARITRTPQPVDGFLNMLVELADLLAHPPYAMTAERWAALAGLIHQAAIGAYRGGATASADRGFRTARTISPKYEYTERRWYKAGARLLGPMGMEQSLALCRRLFRGPNRTA